MKELSIDEKAKAYDKIIKKANKMHHENCEACQMCIEELIPELREEFEDERIRKELISHFCGIRDNCGKDWYGFNINDVITWLEKQGEQSDANKEYRIGYYDALKWVYEYTYGDNYKLLVKDKMQEFIKDKE